MENEYKYLIDIPKNVNGNLDFLHGSCALLFILDFVIYRHSTPGWEKSAGVTL